MNNWTIWLFSTFSLLFIFFARRCYCIVEFACQQVHDMWAWKLAVGKLWKPSYESKQLNETMMNVSCLTIAISWFWEPNRKTATSKQKHRDSAIDILMKSTSLKRGSSTFSQNIERFYYFLPSIMNFSYRKVEHFGLSAWVVDNC